LQNFAAVMSVSEDLLCSFELLKVCQEHLFEVVLNRLTNPHTYLASRRGSFEEGDGQEQAEKVGGQNIICVDSHS
jgi:hypothetical protein